MNLIRRTGSPRARYRPSTFEDQLGRMVETKLEDGVLTLTLPKKQASSAKQLTVQ